MEDDMHAMTSDPPPNKLRFGFAGTHLGAVLIATSDRGVAAIFLGEDRSRLKRELAGAYPDADLIETDDGLADTLAKVAILIDTPQRGLDLQLDLRGSAIELAVWEALRAIPVGETRSYGQLAKALPIPATAQEVGAACAANVLAVAVPCHRVVKADGSIAGYRWGVSRKRRLLQMEAAA